MGCVGAGAILGATMLPRLRRRFAFDRMIALASLGLAAGLIALAYVPWAELVAFTLLLTGSCWLIVLSSLNTSAQRVAPGWVRARTLAVFQLVMQGGLATGSLAWGLVTGAADVETALTIAAAGLVAGVALARRWPLAGSERSDLTPAGIWSDPNVGIEPRPDDGPVLITVEYEIDPEDAERFLRAMEELGRIRRRDGAYRWDLYADVERPASYLETFVVDSWSEHLRQHDRLTMADLELTKLAKSFHRGEQPPAVRHMLWAPAAPNDAHSRTISSVPSASSAIPMSFSHVIARSSRPRTPSRSRTTDSASWPPIRAAVIPPAPSSRTVISVMATRKAPPIPPSTQ